MMKKNILLILFTALLVITGVCSCNHNKTSNEALNDSVLTRRDKNIHLRFFNINTDSLLKENEDSNFSTFYLGFAPEYNHKMVLKGDIVADMYFTAVNDEKTKGKFLIAAFADTTPNTMLSLFEMYSLKYGSPSFFYNESCSFSDFINIHNIPYLSNCEDDITGFFYRDYYNLYGKDANNKITNFDKEIESSIKNEYKPEDPIFGNEDKLFYGTNGVYYNLEDESNRIHKNYLIGQFKRRYFTSIVWEWKNQSIILSCDENNVRIVYSNRGYTFRKSIGHLLDKNDTEQKIKKQKELKAIKDSIKKKKEMERTRRDRDSVLKIQSI